MTHIQMLLQACVDQIIQQNPVVKNIFSKIYAKNGRVLLVGGIVRDCFLGQKGSDLDFEVYHVSFDELQNILSEFGPVSFVGKSFGVLRLHTLDADWSIPRKDSVGRKPKVELCPNMSFKEAFKRRDLTVNAMGIDVRTLELIDPYGGLQDLLDKRLRAPDQEFFKQDPLRLFRVMQFTARLHMQPDAELNNVCKDIDISMVSKERIDEEFKKLFLKSDQPSIGLYWLQKIERFEQVFPEMSLKESVMKALDCFAEKQVGSSYIKLSTMWALFVRCVNSLDVNTIDISKPASKQDLHMFKSVVKKYVHAHDVVDLAAMIAWYVHYISFVVQEDMASWYKWLAHWLGKNCNLATLALAGSCLCEESIIEQFTKRALDIGVLKKEEKPLLSGKDLLHLAQGKELGILVQRAYALQLDLGITNKIELLQKLE